MPVSVLVLYGLAVVRLTGLVLHDDITAPLRTHLVAPLATAPRPGPFLHELLTCPWCISVWLGLMVAPVAVWRPHAWWALIPAFALVSSQIAGMVNTVGRG
jgi:hypothetical protein